MIEYNLDECTDKHPNKDAIIHPDKYLLEDGLYYNTYTCPNCGKMWKAAK